MRLRKVRFRVIPSLVGWAIAALVAVAIHYWTGFSYWAAFAIITIAMAINSFIAEGEDNAPGGFNNPLPPTRHKTARNGADDNARNI